MDFNYILGTRPPEVKAVDLDTPYAYEYVIRRPITSIISKSAVNIMRVCMNKSAVITSVVYTGSDALCIGLTRQPIQFIKTWSDVSLKHGITYPVISMSEMGDDFPSNGLLDALHSFPILTEFTALNTRPVPFEYLEGLPLRFIDVGPIYYSDNAHTDTVLKYHIQSIVISLNIPPADTGHYREVCGLMADEIVKELAVRRIRLPDSVIDAHMLRDAGLPVEIELL